MAKRTTKRDRYEQVTMAIVNALEKGTAPWVCPWDRSQGHAHNGKSGHVYQGINMLLCWAKDFDDPRFFTYNQVKKYGKSHVKRGEKGTPIVKWLFLDKKVKEEDADGNEVERTKRVPILKTYTVFNFTQVEWDPDHQPKEKKGNDIDPESACAEAAALVKKTGAKVKHGSGRAGYRPSTDSIGMPKPGAFDDANAYWATLLHEVTHWTGHESRCNRDLKNRFGSEKYAAEELVAELGAAFLCADLGIEGKLQHKEYIASWIKVLKDDKYALFTAARLAREAVAFVKGEKDSKTETVAKAA